MMLKLRSFKTLGECDRMKTLLEGCGIHCEIRNEFGANTAGAGVGHSLPFSLPEIWIDDQDKDEAQQILSDGGDHLSGRQDANHLGQAIKNRGDPDV